MSSSARRARPWRTSSTINRHNQLYDVARIRVSTLTSHAASNARSQRRGQPEGEVRRLDGRIIHHQIQALPDGGRLLTYFDITQLEAQRGSGEDRQSKLAEVTACRTSRSARGRFSAVLETIDYGVLFMGPDLRSRIINRAFQARCGAYRMNSSATRVRPWLTLSSYVQAQPSSLRRAGRRIRRTPVMRRVEVVVEAAKSYQAEMRRLRRPSHTSSDSVSAGWRPAADVL